MGLPGFLALLDGQHSAEEAVTAYYAAKDALEEERRRLFAPLGVPSDYPYPASWVYHRHSRVTDSWWSPLTDEEVAELTLNLDYKRYPEAPRIVLPENSSSPIVPLGEVIRSRRSVRSYNHVPVAFAVLGQLLNLSCGVTASGDLPLRAAPSGGGLYPVETYVVALAVDGLEIGTYHYVPLENALEHIGQICGLEDLRHVIPESLRIAEPAVFLALTAVFPRIQAKYLERGYRFALLEAGHIAQNMSLVATALGLGSVCVGGFYDDDLNALLGVDGVREAAVYGVIAAHPGEP